MNRCQTKCQVLLAALIVVTCGCKSERPYDPVTLVAHDDPAMNAAIDRARATVDEFITALQSPGASQSSFVVKKGFQEGEQVEHMWIGEVTTDGNTFTGYVQNEAQLIGNIRLGQRVVVAKSEISDWMYIDNGKLVGGFTVRALRDRLSQQARDEFDQSIPFRID